MLVQIQTLNDKQQKGFEKLRRFKVGALFMDPGTGKTRTAYELVNSVPDVDYILWFTPFRTKQNLKYELDKCGELNVDIVGIESLSNSDRLYLELYSKLEKAINPFIIVDESLKIKNSEANRTERIIKLGRLADYKLVLNGTPLSRNLLDLWAQMEFLSPKILKMNFTEFKNTFVEYTKITKRIGRRSYSREFINKYHNVDYLYSLINPFVFEAELELDARKQYIPINFQVDPEMKEEYEWLKEKYLDDEAMEARNNNIFLEITQKMQRLYAVSSEKFDIVEKLIKENGPVLIFCKFTNSAAECQERFKDATVLTYGKHAFGLNLQHFNRIIFFDKTFDYALRLQSEQRVYRLGQKEDCVFYDLTGDVKLEGLFNRNIEKKGRLLQYFKEKSVKELMKEL